MSSALSLVELSHLDYLERYRYWRKAAIACRFSIHELALAHRISERHLRRLFELQIGMPPKKWLEKQRMFEALRMLGEGEPAKVVSYELGFLYPSHFSLAFKRTFGVSPTDYKLLSAG